MLKEYDYIFRRVNMALDFALTAASVGFAHLLRNHVIAPYFLPQIFRLPSRFSDYAWLALAMPLFMVFFLRHNGYYASQRLNSMGATIKAVFLSAIETAAAAMVLAFIFADRVAPAAVKGIVSENVSRGVILITPVILTLLIMLKTFAVREFLMALRKRGKNWRSLLLVGSGENLREFIRLVRSHPFWGFKLTGIIDDTGREARVVEQIPVVGPLSSFWEYLENNPVDEVVFISGQRPLHELAPYFEGCEEMGLRTRLSLHFFRHTIARPVIDNFQDLPVVTYSPTQEMNSALLFKYAFDRVAA